MKKVICLVSILAVSACQGYPGSGGMLGGAVGGTVGAASGAALCGNFNPGCIVVGSVIGAMTGAVFGNSVEKQNQYTYQQRYNAPYYYGENAGTDAAYNAGRARYYQQIQRQREIEAYNRGVRGY